MSNSLKGSAFRMPNIPDIERRVAQFYEATRNNPNECLMLLDPADGMIVAKHTDHSPHHVQVPSGYPGAFIMHSHPSPGTVLSLGDFRVIPSMHATGNMAVANDGMVSWTEGVSQEEAMLLYAYSNSYMCEEVHAMCHQNAAGSRTVFNGSANFCAIQQIMERAVISNMHVRSGGDSRGWQAARNLGMILPQSFSWSRND